MSVRHFKDLLPIDNFFGLLAGIIAGLLVSFLLFGFWWPYWRIADGDLWMVYEAFLLNDGLPQEWFDAPGYFTILLLGTWFHLLHVVGLLDVHALSSLPVPSEAEHAWTAAVRAGRVLSLMLAIFFVLGFGTLLRRLIGDWRVAAAAAFALAFSGGVAMEARIIRTELIAGGLVILSLLVLLIAARTLNTAWRPALVGLAAFLATVGLINKVQLIFLICSLPLIALPFGRSSDNHSGFWRTSPLALPAAALSAVGAALVAIPAASLVSIGFSQVEGSLFSYEPFAFGLFGIYQPIIAVWIGVSMIFFAVLWGVSALETFTAAAAVVFGVALGLLSLDIRYNPQNVIVVINPIEQLLLAARQSHPDLADGAGLVTGLVHALVKGVASVVATRTFVLDPSARPTILLEWLVIAGGISAWRAGERKLVAQVAVLMCVAWGMDAIYSVRGLQLAYFTLTDPLVIIAAALLLASFGPLQAHRHVFAIGMTVIVAHLVLSQAEPLKHTFQRSRPLQYCVEHLAYTKKIERFSFCPAGA